MKIDKCHPCLHEFNYMDKRRYLPNLHTILITLLSSKDAAGKAQFKVFQINWHQYLKFEWSNNIWQECFHFIDAKCFKVGWKNETPTVHFNPAKEAAVKIYHICLAWTQLLTVILLKCSFGSKVKVQMPEDEGQLCIRGVYLKGHCA
jgi:hypothetical protein